MLHVDKNIRFTLSPTDGVGVRGKRAFVRPGCAGLPGLHLPGFCGTAKFVGLPKTGCAALALFGIWLTLHNRSAQTTSSSPSLPEIHPLSTATRMSWMPSPPLTVGPSLTNWTKSTRTSAAPPISSSPPCPDNSSSVPLRCRIGPYRCI